MNLIEAGGNYGWPTLEGTLCTDEDDCDTTGLTPPYVEYSHEEGTAAIGGFVYRGSRVPELNGLYIFSDFGGRDIWAVTYNSQGEPQRTPIARAFINGYAQGNDGELYYWTSALSRERKIYTFVPSGDNPPTSNQVPTKLSETGCFGASDPSQPTSAMIPYEIRAPLWSDDADKKRWIAIPDGSSVSLHADGDFQFPVGTVLSKQFLYDGAPFETRLFMRHSDGTWSGASYEWDADGMDATLLTASKAKTLDNGVFWQYPSRSQCMQCHTEVADFSLGPEVAQLNFSISYPQTGKVSNQVRSLAHIDVFSDQLESAMGNRPALASLSEQSHSVARRARSYLHSNCSGCHRPQGPAQATIDLRYSTPIVQSGLCESPTQGDLGVAGAAIVKPGDPAASVLYLRMSTRSTHQMPPLATTIADAGALAVIYEWISDPQVCVQDTDSDSDGVADNQDNCLLVPNAAQFDNDLDGFGDSCDFDLDNSNDTDFLDLELFARDHGTENPAVDFNGDGLADNVDLERFIEGFLKEPGPTGLDQ